MSRNNIVPIIAVAFLSLILGICLAWGYFYPELASSVDCSSEFTSKKHQATNSDQTNTRNETAGSKSQKSQPPNDASEQTDNKETDNRQIARYTCELARYTGKVAGFTIILAIATIVLGAVSLAGVFLSWSDTRTLQRAYLTVLLGGIKEWTSNKERLACDFILFNAGNLPATGVTWETGRCLSRDSHFVPPKVGICEQHTNIIAPKSKIRKGTEWLETKKMTVFRAGTRLAEDEPCWLYIWGRVVYHDGFQGDRSINFCHRYNLAGTKGSKIGRSHGRQHEKGNATDQSQ